MRKKIIFLFFVVAIIAGVVVYTRGDKDNALDKVILHKVTKGPLVINVSEAGSIKPQEQIIIKSEVEGRRSIIYLIKEGTYVRKGDLLVELDVSELETKRADQEIVVENAEAGKLVKADDLVVAQNQAKADVELAELKVRFAKEDLQKYIEGEYPNNLSEAEGKIKLAEEELERAKDKMEWSKKLYDEKYLSETEMRGDELAWKRSELNLQTAKGNLELLKNYTYKRQVAQLESDLSQAEMSLERTKRKASASVNSAEATLRAKELEYTRQLERLKHYEKQIGNAKIYAPMDGLVIYATSANNRWGNKTPLAEGTEVWERNELIYLPTASSFQAEVEVHESNLKKIVPGQKARIRVDAYKSKIFYGVVSYVSPLPDAQKMWQNPDLKVYRTIIKLAEGGDVLKSGMNCVADIIVDQFEETISIPIQCLVKEKGKSVVYVVDSEGKQERRVVEVGQDNNRFIQIKSGLKEGEMVMENPPLSNSESDETKKVVEDDDSTKELKEKITKEHEARRAKFNKSASGVPGLLVATNAVNDAPVSTLKEEQKKTNDVVNASAVSSVVAVQKTTLEQ